MTDDSNQQSGEEKFNPNEHAAKKQALRDKDREDLRLGRATAAEINKRNLFLGGLDMSKATIVHYGPHSGTKAIKLPKQ